MGCPSLHSSSRKRGRLRTLAAISFIVVDPGSSLSVLVGLCGGLPDLSQACSVFAST